MKLEHKFLMITLAAIILAVPIALAAGHHANLLKVERTENSTLHLQLDTTKKQLQSNNAQLEQERRTNQQLQQKSDEQEKQLQAKAAVKAAATVAAMTTPNCTAYQGLVAQYDWPVHTAMAIMQAESGCRAVTPDNAAINYDGIPDYGLFQLHGINVTDPAENVRIAYEVKYLGAGRSFTPWNTYTSGAYLGYE
jgi:uncharacterized protein YxeA